MTDKLVISIEDETGQAILEGAETGPAGGAMLTPIPGFDLLFDRVSGRLCRVTADLPGCDAEAGNGTSGAPDLRRMLISLFGSGVEQDLRSAAATTSVRSLAPDPALAEAFFRLARFDAARATSPVPATSPLWYAEGAVLALQAGLGDRARKDAQLAAVGLAAMLTDVPLPAEAFGPALVAAALAQAAEPEAAALVRAGCAVGFAGSLSDWLACYGPVPGLGQFGPARLSGHRRLRWGLDLTLLPVNLAMPGLTPDTDLVVCAEQGNVLTVSVRLGPGATEDALRRCRLRLVDPAGRQVIAAAPIVRDAGTAAASIQIPCGLDRSGAGREFWIELVADEERPVRGQTLRELREALRWADSALRARRHPSGLAPDLSDEAWDDMSAAAWLTCGRYWKLADDIERASQAAGNAGANAGQLAAEPSYLAETLGC